MKYISPLYADIIAYRCVNISASFVYVCQQKRSPPITRMFIREHNR